MSDVNKRIAQLCGWRVEPMKGTHMFQAIAPDGKKHPNWGSEESAWDAVPDCEHDLNKSMALFDEGVQITLWWNKNGYHARRDVTRNRETGESLAHATALLWLTENAPEQP